MMKTRWFACILIGLVCVSLMSGCRKKGKAGDNIAGVSGTAVGDEYGLGPRGEYGSEVGGQFAAVFFDYDSSQVRSADSAAVEAVAAYLRQNANSGLVIEGHADERGSNEYNLTLGERRALAVRAYLIGLGISGDKIQSKSYGEEKPADAGHDETAWSQNRRAEFVVVY